MPLKPYHLAWLTAHPTRTAVWLSERLADGFDLHHADGDHFNDNPANLVLIDRDDHRRVHNAGPGLFRLLETARVRTQNREARAMTEGRAAYDLRARTGRWAGLTNSASYWARVYALMTGLPWPPRADQDQNQGGRP